MYYSTRDRDRNELKHKGDREPTHRIEGKIHLNDQTLPSPESIPKRLLSKYHLN